MILSDQDSCLSCPPLIPVTWAPLCLRFLGRDFDIDATARISDNGVPLLRVYLASPRHNARAMDIEPMGIMRTYLIGHEQSVLAKITKKAEEMMARIDYQVAAYCASDLWC